MNGVAGLALATAAFVASHLAMSHPLRGPMVRALGEKGFAGAYSLISLILFGWMLWAARAAQGAPLWVAPDWAWAATSVLMLPVSILLAGAFAKNPAFPHPGAAEGLASRRATGAFAVTRHPMNMAIALWGAIHIAVMASPRNIIIGGGMALLALLGSWGQDRRKAAIYGEAWQGWSERTSFLPLGALLRGRVAAGALWPGWGALAAGTLLWVAASWFHPHPVGPFALLR